MGLAVFWGMPRTLLLTALLLGLTNVAFAQSFDAPGEAQMLEQINALRGENQLAPVARLDTLDAVARAHSTEMASNGQLAHVSTTTGTPEDRVRGAGVSPVRVTENVANHRDTLGAHTALLNSPAHRQNVLDPNVTHVGLGSLQTEQGVFVTQVYAGLPAPAVVAPAPEPVLEEAAPSTPTFELIPPFVERAMEEAAAPLVSAISGADEAPIEVVQEAPAPPSVIPPSVIAPSVTPEAAPSAPPPISSAPPAPEATTAPAATPNATLPPFAQQTLRGLVSMAQSLLGASAASN